jgi:hypothetical protein
MEKVVFLPSRLDAVDEQMKDCWLSNKVAKFETLWSDWEIL